MTDENKRTYIDPDTNEWVTEEYGRKRQATTEEIEATLKKWEEEGRGS